MSRDRDWTAADLVERLGPVALRRIRHDPAPGTATEQDVLNLHEREKRLYELVDGVLVEKATDIQDAYVGVVIGGALGTFAGRHDLGFVLGADGMARLAPGLVRIPDVSFVSWSRVPTRRVPKTPMLRLAPDLAVEVLSPSNTAKEMERKLEDYFDAGVRLVWHIDPRQRSARVFTAADGGTLVKDDESLSGDPVLPGFTLSLRELFQALES